MMSYKPQVALEMRKTVYLDLLHATKRRSQIEGAKPASAPSPGTVVAEIGDADLWGLLATDGDAAKPATKPKAPKPQKPSKTAKKAASQSFAGKDSMSKPQSQSAEAVPSGPPV